ncbi:MAG TPA: hypothetical protein VGH07_06690, partial [Chthoniobacterales bacterium]
PGPPLLRQRPDQALNLVAPSAFLDRDHVKITLMGGRRANLIATKYTLFRVHDARRPPYV